jgi:hypothetical protein
LSSPVSKPSIRTYYKPKPSSPSEYPHPAIDSIRGIIEKLSEKAKFYNNKIHLSTCDELSYLGPPQNEIDLKKNKIE